MHPGARYCTQIMQDIPAATSCGYSDGTGTPRRRKSMHFGSNDAISLPAFNEASTIGKDV